MAVVQTRYITSPRNILCGSGLLSDQKHVLRVFVIARGAFSVGKSNVDSTFMS